MSLLRLPSLMEEAVVIQVHLKRWELRSARASGTNNGDDGAAQDGCLHEQKSQQPNTAADEVTKRARRNRAVRIRRGQPDGCPLSFCWEGSQTWLRLRQRGREGDEARERVMTGRGSSHRWLRTGTRRGARRNCAVRKKETRERGRRKGGRERDEEGRERDERE